MGRSRHEEAVKLVAREIRAGAAEVLAGRVSGHYSQADWEGFAAEIADNLAQRLMDHDPLREVVEASDIRRSDGTINGDGMLQAVAELRDSLGGTKDHGIVSYLLQHLTKVLTSLHLVRGRRKEHA